MCMYFCSTFIKSIVPNRSVLVPPSFWNQRDVAVSRVARTTNAVENDILASNSISAEPTQKIAK